MITCNLMGGLGNQIFQIFATISYAINNRKQFKFLKVDSLGGGSSTLRYTFWNSFFSRLNKPFLTDNIVVLPNNVIKEKEFRFNELPNYGNNNQENYMLSGYFQSYKYFENYYDMVCRLIGLQNMKDTLILKLDLSNNLLGNTISMHFRIGDYKKIQELHPILTKNYYFNALNYIKTKSNNNTNYNILYFCEEQDIDEVTNIINYLKDIFTSYKFARGEKELEDWEQMLLMSCCNHNIIANSSFSWWGAYFNSNENKIVCYPSIWFGPSSNHDTTDLCPPNWSEINI